MHHRNLYSCILCIILICTMMLCPCQARVALARKFQPQPSSSSSSVPLHASSSRYRGEVVDTSKEEDEERWLENTRQRPTKAKRTRGLLDQSFLSSKLDQSPYPFNHPGYLIGARHSHYQSLSFVPLHPSTCPYIHFFNLPQHTLSTYSLSTTHDGDRYC